MPRIEMSPAEYEHVTVTLEGAIEEFNELMREHEYFVTELPDRLATCLEIVTRE
jgi:hypothetical protein